MSSIKKLINKRLFNTWSFTISSVHYSYCIQACNLWFLVMNINFSVQTRQELIIPPKVKQEKLTRRRLWSNLLHQTMRLFSQLSNLNAQFLSLSLQIADQLLNPSQFSFQRSSRGRGIPRHVPCISSRCLELLSQDDQVLFQSRILRYGFFQFLKDKSTENIIDDPYTCTL